MRCRIESAHSSSKEKQSLLCTPTHEHPPSVASSFSPSSPAFSELSAPQNLSHTHIRYAEISGVGLSPPSRCSPYGKSV